MKSETKTTGDRRPRIRMLLAVCTTAAVFVVALRLRGTYSGSFDARILESLRDPHLQPIGPTWLLSVARDITALGSAAVLGALSILSAVHLAFQRRYRAACLLIWAFASAYAANHALKTIFNQPRPGEIFRLVAIDSSGFPSGHAMASTIVYGTLLLIRRHDASRSANRFTVIVVSLLVLAIGLSRVYLGVHYPTDVAAGWSAGIVWLCLFIWPFPRAAGR